MKNRLRLRSLPALGRRENGGDLSWNRASLLIFTLTLPLSLEGRGNKKCSPSSVFPLSLWERAGVRVELPPGSQRPRLCPNSGGVELSGAAKESDRRERIANDPDCLGDHRWVYRFSGDELAGRRGLSGGMAKCHLTRSPVRWLHVDIDLW
jgi:hypothetical protein